MKFRIVKATKGYDLIIENNGAQVSKMNCKDMKAAKEAQRKAVMNG